MDAMRARFVESPDLEGPRTKDLGTDEQGTAAVECALMMLALAPLALYAVYFAEVGLASLRAQEASRYLVWEAAAAGLSDFADAAHEDRSTRVREQAVEEALERYGDDLDGATPLLRSVPATANLATRVRLLGDETELRDGPPGLTAKAVGAGAQELLSRARFNSHGALAARARVEVTSVLLGSAVGINAARPLLPSSVLVLAADQTLLADAWNLDQGDPVLDGAEGGCHGAFCRQVQRTAFQGLEDRYQAIPLWGMAGVLLRGLGMRRALDAAVASLPLSHPGQADSAIELLPADPEGHRAMRRHHTNVFKDTFSPAESPLWRAYQRRGPHFLGCPEPQKREGECAYRPKGQAGAVGGLP